MYDMPKADAPMILPREGEAAPVRVVAPPIGWTLFNINQNVRVKLTPSGLIEMRRQDDEFYASLPAAVQARRPDPASLYRPDADGYAKFQAWDLMQRFGHMMVMGGDLPFETDVFLERLP